jgi:hypothetical protein
LGQRSRKRGRRQVALATTPKPTAAKSPSRSEQRDAAIRATLAPYPPGERPWSIRIAALVAFLTGAAQLALFLFGVKLKVAGAQPKAGSTIVFGVLMFACAAGMWLMRYWAVLGFMALLGITLTYFALALIKASSLLGFAISIVGVSLCGLLFFKLVRVLSRIQMPKYPGR